jgi:hypothetical protein
MVFSLKHFIFETLHSACPAKVNFAYASWAGGSASRLRRLSNFIVKLPWKRSKPPRGGGGLKDLAAAYFPARGLQYHRRGRA